MNRLRYLFKRLLAGIPIVLFALTVTWMLMYLAPINPVTAILGRDANPQAARQVAIDLGLRYPNGDPVPLWAQYVDFMSDMLTFDFGRSWVLAREVPVMNLIANRLPATIWLGFWSVLLAIFVGVPVGLYGGLNSNTWRDYTASFGGIVWRAMPNFWLAVMLAGILSAGGLLSFYRGFLVTTDVIGTPDALGHLFSGIAPLTAVPGLGWFWIPIPNFWPFLIAFKWILPPALVLGSSSMGNEVRIGRTAVLESINSQYVETAKAKGVSMRTIITKHVGRNALIPLLPVIMGEFYLLIGGSVLVESIFGINGMGSLFLTSLYRSDITVALAIVYIFALITIFFNIAQDIAYTFIDPRIGLEGTNE